jgi:hypothetical protein
MNKLTLEETAREINRGRKAASDGRTRYWSEPWAYPFESDEHYEGRREAFEQGFDPCFTTNNFLRPKSSAYFSRRAPRT